ncbi:MAG TPA: hypothetical protein PKD56_03140 [Chitinophagales bacterium]|nr:hypothetical protein [Chitinophagales bacterium]
MNRFLIFILLFLPLQFIAVQAQNTVSSDTVKLSLAEAHAFAVKNNLNNQISWMRVDAARGQVREVKSIGLPQVKLQFQCNFTLLVSAGRRIWVSANFALSKRRHAFYSANPFRRKTRIYEIKIWHKKQYWLWPRSNTIVF